MAKGHSLPGGLGSLHLSGPLFQSSVPTRITPSRSRLPIFGAGEITLSRARLEVRPQGRMQAMLGPTCLPDAIRLSASSMQIERGVL